MRAATLLKSRRRPSAITLNGSLTPFLFQTRTILDQPALTRKPTTNSKDAYTAARLARFGPSVLKALNIEAVQAPPINKPASKRQTDRASVKGSKDGPSPPSPKGRSGKTPVMGEDLLLEGTTMHEYGRPTKTTIVRAGKIRKAPKKTDDVPFEGTSMHEFERPLKSTITRAEKEAFARLFNMVVTPSGEYKSKAVRDGQQKLSTADALEGEVAEPKAVQIQDEDFPEHFPAPLKRMAAEASRKVQEKEEEARLSHELEAQAADKVAREKVEAEKLASDPLYQQQVAQKDRIEALLFAANTDVELWNVLETELFSPTQLLGLDSQKINSKSKPADVPTEQVDSSQLASPPATEPASSAIKGTKSDPRKGKARNRAQTSLSHDFSPSVESSREHNIAIITYIYPIVLRTALAHLTNSFPASSLPFSILPRIKRLGRTSYILGASTPLYNDIIFLTWKTYADFHRIDELLQEFDPSGLEFDGRTLELLEDIAREGERGRRGRMGINSKLAWNMDVVTGGWQKVVEWIPAVRERLEQEAARRAEETARKSEEIFDEKDTHQ